MQHTPGPWEFSADGIWARSPWNARVRIATVVCHSPTNSIDWRANAQVMTAAPDMLAALKVALPELEQEVEQRKFSGNDEYFEGLEKITAGVRAAVAKAEGR